MANHTNYRFDICKVEQHQYFPVQIYPGERHSLRHPDSNEHYLTSLLSHLKKNL